MIGIDLVEHKDIYDKSEAFIKRVLSEMEFAIYQKINIIRIVTKFKRAEYEKIITNIIKFINFNYRRIICYGKRF